MRTRWPGLAVCGLLALLALGINQVLGALSPYITSVILGALVGNLLPLDWAQPGFSFAARTLLRLGVVLLGLRVALADLVEIGLPGLAVVFLVVTATFFGTRWLASRRGVSDRLGLLIGTGYAICGVSAVVAMTGVIGADDEESTYAVGLVTLAGGLSIVILPLLGRLLGLDPAEFGTWAGGAVHDVAQTVATASAFPDPSLAAAIVVKLTRVALLAPLVIAISLSWRRRQPVGTERPPLVPLFVLGFLAMVVLRSTGIVPQASARLGQRNRDLSLRRLPRRCWSRSRLRSTPASRRPPAASGPARLAAGGLDGAARGGTGHHWSVSVDSYHSPSMSGWRAGLVALALGGVVLAVGWVIGRDPSPNPDGPNRPGGRDRPDPLVYPCLRSGL